MPRLDILVRREILPDATVIPRQQPFRQQQGILVCDHLADEAFELGAKGQRGAKIDQVARLSTLHQALYLVLHIAAQGRTWKRPSKAPRISANIGRVSAIARRVWKSRSNERR